MTVPHAGTVSVQLKSLLTAKTSMTKIRPSTLRRFTDLVLHHLYNILLFIMKSKATFGNSKPKASEKTLPNMELLVYLRKQ